MKNTFFFIFFICTILLSGCISIDKAIENTNSVVKETFNESPPKVTENNDKISYYVPSGMVVTEDLVNNVIFEQDDQTFILFVNTNEDSASQVLYESIVNTSKKEPLLLETFEDEERFGYLFVRDFEKDIYEVIIGIGGVKMTTEAKVSDISDSAEQMMKIVSSVAY